MKLVNLVNPINGYVVSQAVIADDDVTMLIYRYWLEERGTERTKDRLRLYSPHKCLYIDVYDAPKLKELVEFLA